MSEQDLIKKYFSHHQQDNKSVVQGIGDDAAIIKPDNDSQLVISTDTLNIGQHFYSDHPPEHLGQKVLAVNLSDIAAMGATPRWATLSLSLSEVNHEWLNYFSKGLYKLANKHDVKIIGGDMVRGPLSITLQIIGDIKKSPLLRSSCKTHDLLYVTGYLGDAAFGLRLLQEQEIEIDPQDHEYFLSKLTRPVPQLSASEIIVNYSKAAIDISDGLLIDLQRMLDLSLKGALLDVNKLPLSKPMQKYMHKVVNMQDILLGGEDYQLLFTIPVENQARLEAEFIHAKLPLTNIGKITEGNSIQLIQAGKIIDLPKQLGFDHFN